MAQIESEPVCFDGEVVRYVPGQFSDQEPYTPSTNWSQMGPIVDREEITIDYRDNETQARKWIGGDFIRALAGKKQGLIAAARCYVTSKLGEKVEIPDQLL